MIWDASENAFGYRPIAYERHPMWFWEKDRMSDLVPVASDRSAEWQIEKMAEFALRKREVGEPSPHMAIVVHLTEGLPIRERLWRGGAYLNAYSVGTAQKIWESWSYDAAVADPNGLAQWIRDNWAGVHTRTERRCVRSPDNFIRAQIGVADWIQFGVRHLLTQKDLYATPEWAYDAWWKVANRIPFFGRYINIRLLEYANRLMPQLGLDLYDIRAIGGWSPIRGLSLFRPEKWGELSTGQAEPVNRIANEVLSDLRQFGPMSYYTFAAMLCEYREAWEDHHQYPGRTHDQELEYASSPKFAHWDEPPDALWNARKALFPHEALGEMNGWRSIRHDLSKVLRDHGYVWSDLRYDFSATTDFAHPVERS